MVISNTDAIFDSNPNTAESLGPSFTIRDIDTTGAGVSMGGEVKKADKYIRFHGNAVACFENIAPGVPRTVMDIQSNVMPEMVGEQDVHCLALRISALPCRKDNPSTRTFPDTSNPSCCN